MMNSSSGKDESKFMRKCINNIIKVPMKVLRKARELCNRSFSDCGGQINYAAYGNVGAYPGPYLTTTTLPRTISENSRSSSAVDNDLRELIKAASIREKKKMMIDNRQQKQQRLPLPPPPRSRSSVTIIGRIDEDSACEFESGSEDVMIKMKRDFYPRSRSYAAPATVPPAPLKPKVSSSS